MKKIKTMSKTGTRKPSSKRRAPHVSAHVFTPALMLSLALIVGLPGAVSHTHAQEDPASLRQPWLNAELIAWDDELLQHHRLARALGYDHVSDTRNTEAPGESMTHPRHSAGLGFYLNDPHKKVQPPFGFTLTEARLAKARADYPHTFSWYPSISRAIDESELAAMKRQHPGLFEKVKAAFERTKSWSHPDAEFPNNLAQLQVWGNGNRWEPAPDVQRRSVIDELTASIVDYARRAERHDLGYTFTGVVIDVIESWREFNWQSNRKLPGHPETARRAAARPGIEYDYATFQEGWFVFLGQLRDELEAAFPDRTIRFIWEPTPIVDAWVRPLAEADYPTLTPELREKIRGDALLDEKPGMSYLTDPDLQAHSHWPPHVRGTASGDLFTKSPHYPTQLAYLGEISSRGSLLMSYGTFDRSRRPIAGYENQFKLIRALSAWQNMRETPVSQRAWDASQNIYHSPTAYADRHAIAGLHSKTDHVYAVLLDPDAEVRLADEVAVSGLRSANTFWEPDETPPAAEIVDGVLRPLAGAVFPVSVIAQVDRPAGPPRVFALTPGTTLRQERATFTLPNSRLLDPGFENGGEGWAGSGNARLKIVPKPVASGAAAAHIVGRVKPWQAAIQDITGVLMNTRQGRYRVTAKVRSGRTHGRASVSINFIERGQRFAFDSEPVPAPANQWITLSAEFDLDWGDWIENAKLVIRRNGDTENYFVDDVALEYLGRD